MTLISTKRKQELDSDQSTRPLKVCRSGQLVMASNPAYSICYSSNIEVFWKVESVLKKRKIDQVDQYLVKWDGFDESFNTWVNRSDFKYGVKRKTENQAIENVECLRILMARAVNDLSRIPLDLISLIFCFLDRASFGRSKQVCRKWLEASKRVRPELNFEQVVQEMWKQFGEGWFSKFHIGVLPHSWSSYPFYPIDHVLANRIVSNCSEKVFVMYPASWKGKKLKALGIVWKEKSIVRDAVLTKSSYILKRGQPLGLAGGYRNTESKGNQQVEHWHQSHGTLSMANHLSQMPNDITPISISKFYSLLSNENKLAVLHTWMEILSGKGEFVKPPFG